MASCLCEGGRLCQGHACRKEKAAVSSAPALKQSVAAGFVLAAPFNPPQLARWARPRCHSVEMAGNTRLFLAHEYVSQQVKGALKSESKMHAFHERCSPGRWGLFSSPHTGLSDLEHVTVTTMFLDHSDLDVTVCKRYPQRFPATFF